MAESREELTAKLEATKAMRRALYELEFPIVKALRDLGVSWDDLARTTGRSEVELQRDFNKSRAW